jgi:hypothetical protein
MTGAALDKIEPLPGETYNAFKDRAFIAAMNEVSARLFLENQTEEGVRRRIDRGDFKYAIKLMKAWFERKPEDVETLRTLKAYLGRLHESVLSVRHLER